MVYYTEDFCHDGEPGFDPRFDHELGWPDTYDQEECWELRSGDWGCRLELYYGTSDTITFNLPEGDRAVYASVESRAGWFNAWNGYIQFIGDEGTWQTSPSDYGTYFFDISSAEIGEIQSIVIYNTQGAFATVRIGVIPEPGATLFLVSSLLAVTAVRRRFRNTT